MAKQTQKKRSRNLILIAIGAFIILGLFYAFWPRALAVDMGEARRQPMTVTIDEQARTRVHDPFVIAAPTNGRLLRVEVEPGDRVSGNETVVARMLANAPEALDIRTTEQARAAIEAAQAALELARTDLEKALADQDLATTEEERARTLRSSGAVSQAALDNSVREKRAADAAVKTAVAAISVREAELAGTRARLIEFEDGNTQGEPVKTGDVIPLTAPVSGLILRVIQQSQTPISAGTPILEIGDTLSDLEIIAELLSTDAVQVSVGDRVIIGNWGGGDSLNGIVDKVEPRGFTKFSALGVEEQRVNVIVRFTDPHEAWQGLGDGYRLEVQIVVWEDDNALTIPSSALVRTGDGWSAFVVNDETARLVPVTVDRNNGQLAHILDGIEPGQRIVLYPGPDLSDGQKVVQRD